MQEVMDEMTTEVSYRDSLTWESQLLFSEELNETTLTPNCMSSLPRNIGCPPIIETAASVETLVLVLLLLNIIATVLPLRLPRRFVGTDPDFIICL
jgi:hypothetical protein